MGRQLLYFVRAYRSPQWYGDKRKYAVLSGVKRNLLAMVNF